MKDRIAIIIQGYSTTPGQMKVIYSDYKEQGYNNIIISSYSNSIPKNFMGPHKINNEDILGNYDRPSPPYKNASNLNYQILTTKRAIQYIKRNLPNVEYVLKLRADQHLKKIGDFIGSWIHTLNKPENNTDVFNKKIITPGIRPNRDWYICDYLSFGTLEDMFNLWNIPITYADKSRAEDYINTYYLYKYFSQKTDDFIKDNLANGSIRKYTTNPLNYFIFDWRLHDHLYSFKHNGYLRDWSIIGQRKSINDKYPFNEI